jgi:hypothetical protein
VRAIGERLSTAAQRNSEPTRRGLDRVACR